MTAAARPSSRYPRISQIAEIAASQKNGSIRPSFYREASRVQTRTGRTFETGSVAEPRRKPDHKSRASRMSRGAMAEMSRSDPESMPRWADGPVNGGTTVRRVGARARKGLVATGDRPGLSNEERTEVTIGSAPECALASGRRRVTGSRIDREASVGETRTTPFLFSGIRNQISAIRYAPRERAYRIRLTPAF